MLQLQRKAIGNKVITMDLSPRDSRIAFAFRPDLPMALMTFKMVLKAGGTFLETALSMQVPRIIPPQAHSRKLDFGQLLFLVSKTLNVQLMQISDVEYAPAVDLGSKLETKSSKFLSVLRVSDL
jgi:hypothetical protein